MSAVRNISSGAYWCGITIGGIVFISVHILDHLEEDGRADIAFKETLNYVQTVKATYVDIHFEVIMGVDANVGFPANMEQISGDAVLPLRASYTPAKVRVVASWMEAMGTCAANTYRSPPGVDDAVSPENLWTRMAKGKPWTRS